MYKYVSLITIAISFLVVSFEVNAGGKEELNNCRTSTVDPCERAGSCAIQGSIWYQFVTTTRDEKFDTQGWPGLCDMVHVSLVQGACFDPDTQLNVVAYLSGTSYAVIPEISGDLACGGRDGNSCTLLQSGDSCSSNSDCCSNSCKGRRESRVCR